jgi:hypothetical protein
MAMDLPVDRCEKGELHAAPNAGAKRVLAIGVQLTIAGRRRGAAGRADGAVESAE